MFGFLNYGLRRARKCVKVYKNWGFHRNTPINIHIAEELGVNLINYFA